MNLHHFDFKILAFLAGALGSFGITAWILWARFQRWYSPFYEREDWCTPIEFWLYSAILAFGVTVCGFLVFIGFAALWQTLTAPLG